MGRLLSSSGADVFSEATRDEAILAAAEEILSQTADLSEALKLSATFAQEKGLDPVTLRNAVHKRGAEKILERIALARQNRDSVSSLVEGVYARKFGPEDLARTRREIQSIPVTATVIHRSTGRHQ